MKKFSNYQIEVQLEEGPKDTEIATVHLEGDLALTTGWKKRIFILKAKEVLTGRILKPVHVSPDQIEFHERETNGASYEFKLNSRSIRLFRQRWPGMTRWLKKF